MISNTDLLSYVASGKIVRPAYLDKAEYIFKIGLQMCDYTRSRAVKYFGAEEISSTHITCQEDFMIGSVKKWYLEDSWPIDQYMRDAIFVLQTLSFNSKRDTGQFEVANMGCFEILTDHGLNDHYDSFFEEFLYDEQHAVFCKSHSHDEFYASDYRGFTGSTLADMFGDPSSYDLCIEKAPIFFRPQDIHKASREYSTITLERDIGRSDGVFYTAFTKGFVYMLGTFEDARKILFRKWSDYSGDPHFDVESDNYLVEEDYPSFTSGRVEK